MRARASFQKYRRRADELPPAVFGSAACPISRPGVPSWTTGELPAGRAAAAVSLVLLPHAVSAPAPRMTSPAVASARRVRVRPEKREVEFTCLT